MARLPAGLALGVVAACALATSGATQTGTVLTGAVTDAETGDAVIGAAVYAPALGVGAVTDGEGRYRLPLPADTVALAVSSAGYQTARVSSAEAVGGRLDVTLVPAALGEVVVESRSDGPPERTAQAGQITLSGREVQDLPAFLGEADVLKAVQLLPGVRGGAEGTAGLHVRGGSPDQTLVLLDGVPVYNASHLFGFFSTFNGDAVDRAELSKGALPARYGGRLGAVLDVRLREPDPERLRLQGQIGLLSTRLLAEGPIVPGRISVSVSARRTHIDLLARPLIDRANRSAAARSEVQITPEAGFYDLQARADWRPSVRDRVSLSVYGGADDFSFQAVDPEVRCAGGACDPTGASDETSGALEWGNRVGALRWTRTLSSRTQFALAATTSDYRFDAGLSSVEGQGGPAPAAAAARYRSGIRDLGVHADLDLAVGRGHTVRLGGVVSRRRFTPGALAADGSDGVADDTPLGGTATDAWDAAVYAEDAWTAGPLALDLGLRAVVFATERQAYSSVEPRVSAALRLAPRLAVKASVATAQQPVHLLTTGAGIGLPADLWVPADSIGPQRGTQLALGLAGSSKSGRTTWTVEGYWRTMRGLVAYRDGAAFTTPTDDWQTLVITGDGRARGLETLVRHRAARVTAWGAYTLAWSDRRFDGIDGGAWFPYRYDRRHDLSTVLVVRLGRFDVSAALAVGTGDAITLPAGGFDASYLRSGNVSYWTSTSSGALSAVAYGPRNGQRLPAYHRLDLGATWFLRRGERPHALALHVYNATNRKNPFATLLDDRTDPATGRTRQQLVGVALFPILPTLSYQFSL